MHSPVPSASDSWQSLLETAGRVPTEDIRLPLSLDESKRLRRVFDPSFPFQMHAYRFVTDQAARASQWLNWHDYLELIIPITGTGRFAMGGQEMDFTPGDLLVVESVKPHGIIEAKGEHQSLVIFFMPEYVFHPGSVPCDYDFLSPFFGRAADALPLLPRDSAAAAGIHAALIHLVEAWLGRRDPATCKVHLLYALNGLREYFGSACLSQYEYKQRQRCVERVQPILEHLREHFAEPLSLGEAAAKSGMSPTVFKGCFKAVTGTTFSRYRVHLRLSMAAQMLRESDLSVGEVAHQVGFSDQSYFDRRFRKRFGTTPCEYRQH